MMNNFKDLDDINFLFEQIVKESLKKRHSVFKENEAKFKDKIVDLIFDLKKFETVANEIFIETVSRLIKTNSFLTKKLDIKIFLKEFPECRGILKKFYLDLKYGNPDEIIGSIVAETNELDRFKMVIFLNSICFMMIGKEFKGISSLSKSEKRDFGLGIIRVIIHELTHFLDFFRYTREQLIKEFDKFYSLQRGERRAACIEFLYQFVQKQGKRKVSICPSFEAFNVFIRESEEWKTIILPNYIEPNAKFYDGFLEAIYSFFKKDRNEFGKLIKEGFIPPYFHVTRVEDIKNIDLSEETIKMVEKCF